MIKKPTRRDLLLVVGQLQDIIGRIGASAMDDKQRERAATVQAAVEEGMELCILARGFDPPLSGTWPRDRAPSLRRK